MKNKIIFILMLSFFSICSTSYADSLYSITNKSSFYLFSKDSSAACPASIAPGATSKTDYWCGFIACATSQYDLNQGCMEYKDINHSELTQGGYATWFSISAGSNLCTVSPGNIYQCTYHNTDSLFDINYLNVTQTYSAGPNQGMPVILSKPTIYFSGPIFRGINISGMEYDGTFLDAMYQHPDLPDMLYFVQQGMNTIRFPIRWEFILSDQSTNLVESHNPTSPYVNQMYLQSIHDSVKKYLESGVNVILDLHSYMRFCGAGESIGQANEPTDPVNNHCTVMNGDQLAYVWGILADYFADLAIQFQPNNNDFNSKTQLMFGLMNEPFSDFSSTDQMIKTNDLFAAEVKAIQAIRDKQINNLIILSGNYWDPLHGWTSFTPQPGNQDFPPNGQVFTAERLNASGITDQSHIAIEVHQYFNENYSGTTPDCIQYKDYNDFKNRLQINDFNAWLKANHMKVLLTEFGASNSAVCQEDMNYMLQFVQENSYDPEQPQNGGFIGWTAWRANRHTGDTGFAPFNYLQDENYNVYGAMGSSSNSPPGTGIVKGQGNGLMSTVFSRYLLKP